MVRAVGVGRMVRGTDLAGVVEEQIEDKMALVLMRSDHGGRNRHVIADDRAHAHAILETKAQRPKL